MEFLIELWGDILKLGLRHNVNPVIFALLYVGSIPPYLGSLAWFIRNFRQNKALPFPIISTLFFFILPSMYVVIFGENVAWWVYLIIAIMVLYGSISAIKKVKGSLKSGV